MWYDWLLGLFEMIGHYIIEQIDLDLSSPIRELKNNTPEMRRQNSEHEPTSLILYMYFSVVPALVGCKSQQHSVFETNHQVIQSDLFIP